MPRRREPVRYEEFRQQVRRWRRSDVLRVCARLNSLLERAKYGRAERPSALPNYVQDFSVAGVAQAALVAGNDHRRGGFSQADLVGLCWFYVNVEEPTDGTEPGRADLRGLLARLSYEQFQSQLSPMEQVGRSLVLFEELAIGVAGMPSEHDWRRVFGASVRDLVHVGFVAYATVDVHAGSVPIEHMGDDRFVDAYEQLTPGEALDVLERFYGADIDQAAAWARERERRGYEKWSPSPLAASPVVALADGEHVVPWPRLVIERFSPSGLFYAGIEAFGNAFSDALGAVFEEYVGDQLRLLSHARVLPQATYIEGGSEKKTCDWFVVTDEVVVLVEVKATRPTVDVRTGEPSGLADIERKVGHAADQLERTAPLIRTAHSCVAHIPAGVPIVGLVVTLEPFFMLDDWLYQDVVGRRTLPVCVSYSHVLEGTVAALAQRTDVGARLASALTESTSMGMPVPPRLERAAEDLDGPPNPILAKAWARVFDR